MLHQKSLRIVLFLVLVLSLASISCKFNIFAGEAEYPVPTTDARATQLAIDATRTAQTPTVTPTPIVLPYFTTTAEYGFVLEQYILEQYGYVSIHSAPEFSVIVQNGSSVYYMTNKFSIMWDDTYTIYEGDTIIVGDPRLLQAYFQSLDTTGLKVTVVTGEKIDDVNDTQKFKVCWRESNVELCRFKINGQLNWQDDWDQ